MARIRKENIGKIVEGSLKCKKCTELINRNYNASVIKHFKQKHPEIPLNVMETFFEDFIREKKLFYKCI